MQAPFADPLLPSIELAPRSLPLVGRETEMQLIATLLDTAELQPATGARALIMSGESGVGKTRLLAEMCQEAEKRGFRLLTGRAFEIGNLFPYQPFREALQPIIRATSREMLRYLFGLDDIAANGTRSAALRDASGADVSISLTGNPMAAALAHLFPDLPHLLQVTIMPESLSPDQEKFRLFDAIATLLEKMSLGYPVMLSIDNLQWADSASLELTMYLTVRLHTSRVALVGVTRPPGSSHPLQSGEGVETQGQSAAALQILSELMRQGLLLFLPVRPLSLEGAEQHLRALLPGTISGAETLLVRADGNPFFLEELVRMLTLNGQLVQRDGAWDVTRTSGAAPPASISLAVGQRLQTLSKNCLEAMRVAALFGRTFPLQALAMVLDEEDNRVQAIIEEALEAAIIVPPQVDKSLAANEDELDDGAAEQPASSPGYLFSQGLVQEVLSSQVPIHLASTLHGKIGAALKYCYGSRAPAAELARHFVLSGERGEALRWSLRAGQDAIKQQAYREAIAHFRNALKLMESGALGAGEGPLPSLAQVHVMIGESWFKIGELNQAGKAFQKALEEQQDEIALSDSDDRAQNNTVPLAARANRMLADVYRMQGKYELTLAHLHAARGALDTINSFTAEKDKPLVPVEDEHHHEWMTSRSYSGRSNLAETRSVRAELVLLLQAQATMDLLLNKAAEAEKELWQSYQLATELGDRGSQAFALHMVSWIRGWGEHIHEAIRLQEQAHDLFVAVGDPFRAALGDQGLGIIYQAQGEMEKARLHNLRGLEMARRYGVRHVLGWLQFNQAVMALAEGKWTECESRLQQAMQEAEATGNERLKPVIKQVQAELAFRKGEWQSAEQFFKASISAAINTEWYPSTLALYGHFLAVTGRKSEAKAQLAQAAGLQEPVGYSGHYYIPFLAEGFLHIGESEQATGYIERIQKLRGFMYYGVAVDRIRGEVAALDGNWDEAGQAFDDGLRLCRRVGNQPEEAAILYEQARTMLMRVGKQTIPPASYIESVQQLCYTAREIFLRYDMQRSADMVKTLLDGTRQLDIQARTEKPHRADEDHLAHAGYVLERHLTRRELDVMRLVAEGQTDREVAEALVISPRTVNRHLGNIFVKLDVPGRAAAVAYAIRQGLVG